MTEAERIQELLQRSFAAVDPASLRDLAERWRPSLDRLRAEAGGGVLPPERVLALVPELLGDPAVARTELDAAARGLASQVRGIAGAAEALRDAVRATAGPLTALRAAREALPGPSTRRERALAELEEALSARLPLPEADRALAALAEAGERLGRLLAAGGFQAATSPELASAGQALAELEQALAAAGPGASASLPAALWSLADAARDDGDPVELDLRVLSARLAEAEGGDPRWAEVFERALALGHLALARSSGQRLQVQALAAPADLARVAAVATRIAELAVQVGDRRAEVLARLEIASARSQLGAPDEAIAEALGARERSTDLPTWARAELVLAQLREAAGDREGARRGLRRVVGAGQSRAAFPAETARAAIALGRLEWPDQPDRSATLWVAAREIARRRADWPTWASAVQAAVECLGSSDRAALLAVARRELEAEGPETAPWQDWLRSRFGG